MIRINSSCYLDPEAHTITIQVERATFTIMVEEFLDFYRDIDDLRDFMKTSGDYVVGQEEDLSSGEIKDIFIPKPDEDDYT